MTTDTTIPVSGLLEAPLTRRMLLTLFSTAGLTGIYGLYSAVVTPLVSPASIPGPDTIATFPAPPPPPENVRMAEQYLPSQPWAASAKYQFRTKQAIVYANEWEPSEGNQAVRFRPFAMIYLQHDRKEGQPPITVVGESAYLKFEKKFDSVNPDPGRVIGGALQGNVRIAGPDGLAIVGRNFIYSEKAMRLWSDENVLFAWSSHRGRGYGLQVELIADETATPSDSIGVTGVQSIRLRRNVAMDLSFVEREGKRSRNPFQTAEGADAKKDADGRKEEDKSGKSAKAKPDDPVEVRVRSTGSFEFDAEANVGTFSDFVRVYRPTGVGKDGSPQYDSLHCDQLTLSFEPKMPAEVAAAAPTDSAAQVPAEGPPVAEPAAPREPEAQPHRELKDGQREGNFRNLTSRLEFRRARARGKQVVLISEANDLTAYLTDLIYDVQTRVASLTNPELVKVVQGTSELQSPGITLLHDPHGKLTSIWCQGPGWLKYRDPDTGVLQLAAQWQRQLRKYPEAGETGLDIIELEQQALVRQPEQKTGLAADFIRLWMNQQEVRATRPGEERGDRSNQVRLKRMLALKDVALVSPEMQAETNRLEVAFEDRAPSATEPAKLPGAPPADGKTSSRDRRAIRPVIHQSVADAASVGKIFPDHPTQAASATTRRRREVVQLLRPAVSQFAVDDEPAGSESSKAEGAVPPAEVLDLPDAPRGRPPARTSTIKDSRKSLIALPKDELVPPPSDAPASAEQPEPKKNKAGESTLRPGDGPIQVYSDIIRVRAVQGDSQEKTRMEEVWTEGNVYVTQEHGNDDPPLELIGDKLHVENRSDLDQVLHVTGAPAHIYDRGMHIEGKNVHLDRVRNKAWVDGAGLLQLPVKSGLNGEKLTSQQLLDVWWKEKMTFDGEYSRFYGDVRSVLNDSKMLCQAMEVKLTGRISFTARVRDREVKVETVDCRDGVQFDSTEYTANKLSEVRKGHVSRFTLDQTTGRTQAYGPGHIMFWRRGNGRRAALGPGIPGLDGPGSKPKPKETPRATAPAGDKAAADVAKTADGKTPEKAAENNPWEYTRVDFVGKSDGNVQQRFTTFEERVNVVYGPVERPLATVDPDALPKEGGWMRCDSLRLQQHAAKEVRSTVGAAKPPEGQKPPGHVELLGTGNCELDGRTFHAQADTISYDESKGLYVLRSLGNRKATISRQKQIGSEYSTAEAQRMEFVPSRNQLKLDRATSLDGIQ